MDGDLKISLGIPIILGLGSQGLEIFDAKVKYCDQPWTFACDIYIVYDNRLAEFYLGVSRIAIVTKYPE